MCLPTFTTGKVYYDKTIHMIISKLQHRDLFHHICQHVIPNNINKHNDFIAMYQDFTVVGAV